MNINAYKKMSVLLALSAIITDVGAQQFPNKPIRMVVAFAPGGGTDLIARAIALKLQESVGQTVVVDNRSGGGGNIGTDMVAKSPADGYTLLLGYVGNLAINPWLFKKIPYDPIKDFSPISLTTTAPNLLVVHPAVTASNPKELVALAKGKPGALSYASAGNGTVGHMVAELFKTVTGTNIVHVPYKGNGPAVSELLGGHVQLMFAAPAAVLPLVEAKRLKAIAVASAKREPGMPEIPTFVESGFPKVEASGWYGVLAAGGTPKVIVQYLNKEIVKVMSNQQVKERLITHGYTPTSSTPEEFSQLIKSDLAKWQAVVKASGATTD